MDIDRKTGYDGPREERGDCLMMKAIDRFCARHPRFGVRNLMLYLVIGNAIVWLFGMIDATNPLYYLLTFSAYHILHGQVWRLVTFVLVPQTDGIWLLLALYFYYFIGTTLERQWGTAKFTVYYIFGMVLTILYGLALYWITGVSYGLTASYLNLSMFFAFATLYPDTRVLVFFLIPIKIKWLGLLNAAYFLISILNSPFPINLLPLVAVANYLVFCGGWIWNLLRPSRWKQRRRTVHFQQEVRRVQREQAQRPYTRKCEVCGRTDADNPGLEFRYCSRCQGLHCFCMDHINSHVHFTE